MTRRSILSWYIAWVIATGCSSGAAVVARQVAVRDSAGRRIVDSSAPQWAPNERWRIEDSPSVKLFSYSRTGQPRQIGSFPGDEFFEGNGFAIRRLPFARSTRFAVIDATIDAATDDSYEIRVLDRNGRVTMLVRRRLDPEPVAEGDMRAERKRLRHARQNERATRFRGMPDSILGLMAAEEDRMFSQLPFPPRYPAYASIIADRHGYLWVQDYQRADTAADASNRWSVFDPDGRWLGYVELPRRFTLYAASTAHVLGVQTDELGVEYVRAFPILRQRRASDSAAPNE